jgi:hypothetical protein
MILIVVSKIYLHFWKYSTMNNENLQNFVYTKLSNLVTIMNFINNSLSCYYHVAYLHILEQQVMISNSFWRSLANGRKQTFTSEEAINAKTDHNSACLYKSCGKRGTNSMEWWKEKQNWDYDSTPATKLLGPFQTIQYGSHHSTEVS